MFAVVRFCRARPPVRVQRAQAPVVVRRMPDEIVVHPRPVVAERVPLVAKSSIRSLLPVVVVRLVVVVVPFVRRLALAAVAATAGGRGLQT